MKSIHLTLAAMLSTACAATPAAPTAPITETLPSGVKIVHTQVGSGPQPTIASTVRVHYRGTLANGTEFDSTYRRGMPASFPLNRVVPC